MADSNIQDPKREILQEMGRLDAMYRQEERKLRTHVEDMVRKVQEKGRQLSKVLKAEYESSQRNLQKQLEELNNRQTTFAESGGHGEGVASNGNMRTSVARSGKMQEYKKSSPLKYLYYLQFKPSTTFANFQSAHVGTVSVTGDGREEITPDDASSFPEQDNVSCDIEQQLRFHHCHGDNVEISEDGKSANRLNGFQNAVLFTSRQVNSNEKVSLWFTKQANWWSSSMAVGFANESPDDVDPSLLPSTLSRKAKDEFGYWVVKIPRVHREVNNKLSFWVDAEGTVWYSVNDYTKGVLVGDVDTSRGLWGVIDLCDDVISGIRLV